MLSLLTLSCLVVGILAGTTAPPHVHHESSESELFSFGYEHSTQALLVRSSSTCYIWELTADEQANIHTNAGMTAAESRAIKEIDTAYYTIVPKQLLHPNIVKLCNMQNHHGANMNYGIVH